MFTTESAESAEDGDEGLNRISGAVIGAAIEVLGTGAVGIGIRGLPGIRADEARSGRRATAVSTGALQRCRARLPVPARHGRGSTSASGDQSSRTDPTGPPSSDSLVPPAVKAPSWPSHQLPLRDPQGRRPPLQEFPLTPFTLCALCALCGEKHPNRQRRMNHVHHQRETESHFRCPRGH